jgi:hypothetical protein
LALSAALAIPTFRAALWASATLIPFLLPLPLSAASSKNFLTRFASALAVARGLALELVAKVGLPTTLVAAFLALFVDFLAFLESFFALETALFAFSYALAAAAFCLAVALLQGFLTAISFFSAFNTYFLALTAAL